MICIFNKAASPPLCLHGNRYPAYIRELKRGECLYYAFKKRRKKYVYNNFLAINTFYQKNVCLIKAFVVLR